MISAEQWKGLKGRRPVVVTAYDAPFAGLAEGAGVDMILVGDTLANVVLNRASTREVDMDIMEIFVGAVCSAVRHTHICADLPYLAYENEDDARANAERFMRLGAHSVKLEGRRPEVVRALFAAGIPVMGHLGLLPQTAESFKQVGRGGEEKTHLTRAARELVEAGAFSLVLEHMDYDLAAAITASLGVPTIGIGAGPRTDGQVLVLHDLLGLGGRKRPPFARAFADLNAAALKGITDYARAVRDGAFPSPLPRRR